MVTKKKQREKNTVDHVMLPSEPIKIAVQSTMTHSSSGKCFSKAFMWTPQLWRVTQERQLPIYKQYLSHKKYLGYSEKVAWLASKQT